MGSGLSGGPLTGNVTTAALPPAPAGESAVLSGPLGAGSSDVVTKAGSTQPDATVNSVAELFRVCTGIGGTEVGRFAVLKGGQATGFDLVGVGTSGTLRINNSVGLQLIWSANAMTVDGTNVTMAGSGGNVFRVNGTTTAISYRGTDSTGSPGNATIDKPTGKSSIAAGAASVTITNSLCAATSRVMITQHARDATCKELIVVPGAGSFAVSGSAAATADLPFSWEVSNII